MSSILHDFPIFAPVDQVYAAITTPEGLDAWWTDRSSGEPLEGSEYELWFGPDYDWRAVVTKAEPNQSFELELTTASEEWVGTVVGLELEPRGGHTQVRFYHMGWDASNEHYRISSFCWAMYLRIMKRWVEKGEKVPYRDRLDV
ncbi:MAG: SRPBCC domain-containing protein [Rhodothermales bacterium]